MKLKKVLSGNAMTIAYVIITIIIAACDNGGGGGSGSASGNSSPSTGNVKAVATGTGHTLVLKNDGTVWAFGSNTSGELGLGNKINYISKAQQITSFGNDATAIFSNISSLVLKKDGTLWAFGLNSNGQLGLGFNNDITSTPTQVTSFGTDVSSMSSGADHTLVVKKSDGSLWAFGNNDKGQLGLGNHDSTNIAKPAIGVVTNGVVAVAAGRFFSLALKNDGTLWAFGSKNELNGTVTGNNFTIAQQVNSPLGNEVQAIATGGIHSLVLKKDGTVWAFGNNYYGQLGLGFYSSFVSTPSKVIGDISNDVQAIAAGSYFSLVLKKNGTVCAFGKNDFGQLQQGLDTTSSNRAIQAKDLDNSVQAISAGGSHSMVIKNDGTLWAFGGDNYGQLGIGTILANLGDPNNHIYTITPTRVIIP